MSLLREWTFQLWDAQRKISIDDDSAKLLVLTADAPTAPTIYSDDKGTSVSNAERTPRSFTNGWVKKSLNGNISCSRAVEGLWIRRSPRLPGSGWRKMGATFASRSSATGSRTILRHIEWGEFNSQNARIGN